MCCSVFLWAAEYWRHADLSEEAAMKPDDRLRVQQVGKCKRAWDYSSLKLTAETRFSCAVDQSGLASGIADFFTRAK